MTQNFVKSQVLLVLNLSVSKYFQESLVNRAQIQKKNSTLFRSFCPGKATEIHAHSKDEGPRDIGHKISMVLDTKKSNLGSK